MLEDKVLGKRVAYPKRYCPEILVPVPRSLNRENYHIYEPETLFCGYDIWHAYEASFILTNGMPVAGVLKIVYPSSSPFIVESKSLKLYLGSFHMEPLGTTLKEGIQQYTETIRKDLSKLLSTETKVCFYSEQPDLLPFDFNEYTLLEKGLQPEDIRFSIYQENPDLLKENICEAAGEIKVSSHLLKSNCKITNQPDWGTIYVHLKGDRLPDKKSLLKYIVSLRNENHFHEEICEMMFKRLTDIFHPERLMISCLYTRRGGIDICPCRATSANILPKYLPQCHTFTQRTFRQ